MRPTAPPPQVQVDRQRRMLEPIIFIAAFVTLSMLLPLMYSCRMPDCINEQVRCSVLWVTEPALSGSECSVLFLLNTPKGSTWMRFHKAAIHQLLR